jgi:hypothetical protein
MKRLIVLFLLGSPLVFGYQNKTFNWTPPNSYTDGSPLPQSEIASYNIYCNGSLLGSVINTAGTDVWTSPDGSLPPGNYVCYATTVGTDAAESGPSNSVNFIVDPLIPGAPVGLTVQLP